MKFTTPLLLTGPDGSSIVKTGLARSNPLESFMFTRFLLAAAGLLIAAAVLAQTADPAPKKTVLGKAIKVEGLVTVSDANGISRVKLEDPVIDRTRYVTSSTGYVTLRMDKGCDIELKPNQALTIDGDRSCEALWALIGSFGPSNSALVPFAVGGVAILLMGGGGGTPTTPNNKPPDDGNTGQIPDFPPQSPE
jgi:hypothetical protein